MFADVSFSTEAMAVIASLGAGLIGAISLLFKLLLISKDKALADMQSSRDSFKDIASQAVDNVEIVVNRIRAEKGLPEFKPLKPVVPEHDSPISKSQRETAWLQTLRARMVAASLELGIQDKKSDL